MQKIIPLEGEIYGKNTIIIYIFGMMSVYQRYLIIQLIIKINLSYIKIINKLYLKFFNKYFNAIYINLMDKQKKKKNKQRKKK